MNTAALVEEIEARVEGMPVRGAQAPRALQRDYSKRIVAVPARKVVKIVAALIVHRRVPRFIGDELIASRADALGAIDLLKKGPNDYSPASAGNSEYCSRGTQITSKESDQLYIGAWAHKRFDPRTGSYD
jgi:hypothetical protein